MKRHLTPLLLILASLHPASAADYYVATTGNDASSGTSPAAAWRTLRRAVTQPVAPGDTVHVADGSYTGFATSVSGAPGAPITWKAEGANVEIFEPDPLGPSPKNDNIKLIWADHNVVDGFRIRNAPRAGISVLGDENDLIEGCVVRNCDSGYNQKWGIITWYAKDVLIEGNECHHSIDEHGIYHGDNGDDAVIRDNVCHDNNDMGIHVLGGYPGGLGDGINQRCLIERNVIYSNGYGGGAGIDGDGVQDSIYRNNLLYDQHASGIILFQYGAFSSSNNLIVNNTILMASDGRWALKIDNSSTGNVVYNNVLYHAGGNGSIAIEPGSMPGFTSDRNVVVDRFSVDGDASTISFADWKAQTGQDVGSIVIDAADLPALFADPTGNDWHLRNGSPAIDAGLGALAGTSAPADDFEGDGRPSAGAWDIGCDEHVLPVPVADFSATPQVGGAPLNVQFTDLSTGSIASWSWSFGDGGSSTSQSPSHVYAAPGSYDVSLTVTGGAGSDTEARAGYVVVTAPGAELASFLSGRGRGPSNPNEARIHTLGGVQVATFTAYGAGQWGTLVAAGDVDGSGLDNPMTGPGPGAVYGPQVRGWERDGAPLAKVSFFAYGTLRYGVNVAAAGLDADAPAEILTGAGPGAVFGPHVRGFNYDGVALSSLPKVSFFAYQTLKFGANVARADLDDDGFGEILTGPGPSSVFGAQLRGFDYDGAAVTALAKVNFVAFSSATHGVNVAGGNVDGDGYEELLAARGPGTTQSAQLAGFDVDGGSVTASPGLDATPFTTSYGARVAAGDLDGSGSAEVIGGPGEDPAAAAAVRSFFYGGSAMTPLGAGAFDAFGGGYGVVVASGMLGY